MYGNEVYILGVIWRIGAGESIMDNAGSGGMYASIDHQLVHNMATCVSGTTLISWDIAYSDRGWLMIETNDNGDWSIIQSIKKIGKKEILYTYMDKYFQYQRVNKL